MSLRFFFHACFFSRPSFFYLFVLLLLYYGGYTYAWDMPSLTASLYWTIDNEWSFFDTPTNKNLGCMARINKDRERKIFISSYFISNYHRIYIIYSLFAVLFRSSSLSLHSLHWKVDKNTKKSMPFDGK